MFIPLFEATAFHILEENKQAENTNWKTKVNYTVYWIGFFKLKSENMHGI